ncbi:MAG TPA: enoyl-CoA hydratase/isomerase family protein [Hyphomicrobiaceae bacterium]|nr:enoyl-CoA hydratase/isomerase family protein [Hyphomicrobiaceae bacterium]
MTTANDDLIYEINNEIGLITLNRPQARNALTFEMYGQIADILENAPTDGSVKAIIITGAGDKAFAAGTDISLFRDFNGAENGIEYETKGDANLARMETCPVPVIAAISGACTGGGAAIAAICDIRISSKDLKFGFPIARTLGNCLSAANYGRLVHLLGEARVVEMIFTSRLIEASEARAIGLVSEVVEDNAAVRARALELAERLKGHAPLTMRATKTILRRLRQARPAVEDHDIIREVYGSADFREGLEAFLAKRKPNWTGK